MLRRDFLKYLSSLPIIGSLFALGESGASEGQPESLLKRIYDSIYEYEKGGMEVKAVYCSMEARKKLDEEAKARGYNIEGSGRVFRFWIGFNRKTIPVTSPIPIWFHKEPNVAFQVSRKGINGTPIHRMIPIC